MVKRYELKITPQIRFRIFGSSAFYLISLFIETRLGSA